MKKMLSLLEGTGLGKLNKFEFIAVFQSFVGMGGLTYFIWFCFDVLHFDMYCQSLVFFSAWGGLFGCNFLLGLFTIVHTHENLVLSILELTGLLLIIAVVSFLIHPALIFLGIVHSFLLQNWFVVVITLVCIGWFFLQIFIVKIIVNYDDQKSERKIE